MKILLISDTHHNLRNARAVLDKIHDKMDMVFHLGDMVEDALILKKQYTKLPFYFVLGNNDFGEEGQASQMVTVKGCRLLLTHGHAQHVHWNYDTISYWAEEKHGDVVVFGHTHKTVNDNGGRVMLVNPGSISIPRDGRLPTFGILEILEDGQIQSSVMEMHSSEDFRIRSNIKGVFSKMA